MIISHIYYKINKQKIRNEDFFLSFEYKSKNLAIIKLNDNNINDILKKEIQLFAIVVFFSFSSVFSISRSIDVQLQ